MKTYLFIIIPLAIILAWFYIANLPDDCIGELRSENRFHAQARADGIWNDETFRWIAQNNLHDYEECLAANERRKERLEIFGLD